ncbi:MAG: hypothetical protein R2762_11015 [Bryobacteraceae bacterium]
MMPILMAAGAALSVINTKAVIEALLGVKTSFVRTPKYAITGNQKQEGRVAETNQKYRSRSGWLPYIELGFAAYFVTMVMYAVESFNFFAVPLLTIFVAGYGWAGVSTLHQEYKARMAWERARKLQAQSAR